MYWIAFDSKAPNAPPHQNVLTYSHNLKGYEIACWCPEEGGWLNGDAYYVNHVTHFCYLEPPGE